jgi:hypothetical protein
MSRQIWCVFQKLPDEECPRLASLCATREIAQEIVRLEGGSLEPRDGGAVWTIQPWSVVEGEIQSLADVEAISRHLDPLREGIAHTERGDD